MKCPKCKQFMIKLGTKKEPDYNLYSDCYICHNCELVFSTFYGSIEEYRRFNDEYIEKNA